MNKKLKKELRNQESNLLAEIDILLKEVQGLLKLVERKEEEVFDIREKLSNPEVQNNAAA